MSETKPKMKSVVMTVNFDVRVPQDTDTDELTLNIRTEDMQVHGLRSGLIAGAKVEGYRTVMADDCEEVH